MALSVSYWSSPMEKLILHLSPVARRRTLKNNNQSHKNSNHTSSLGRQYGRHRNRSEPQKATSMKNVSHIEPQAGPPPEAIKNPLDCDVKTLRLYSIQKVSNAKQKKCVSNVMQLLKKKSIDIKIDTFNLVTKRRLAMESRL